MLLPIVIIGGVIGLVALVRAHAAQATPAAIVGASPTPAISALGQLVKNRQLPPPPIVIAAVNEALAIGRHDLATDITRAFVEPIVRARQATAVSPAPPPPQANASAQAEPPPSPPAPAVPAVIGSAMIVSPIDGVDNLAWSEFVGRLDREAPTFATDRHVGRFRQRKDRLIELGVIDVSTPEQQYQALVTDLTNAYTHAKSGGLVADYIATTIAIADKEHPITLSGLLGVIQAAGLEGAYEWLEKPSDRKRFPGTTRMFLNTNGVF